MIRATALWGTVAILATGSLSAQNPLSVSKPEADNSVAAELRSFTVDERLQVNLFADESMGIANPVCFRWDASGRLWVLCTWAYPQLKPSDRPNDKLLILEDTDNDGRADRVSTFIDGLNMPTGFALGHGGVYIGEGHDLIHVADTDNDGKADSRKVLFTGFGTGDTHQNINSFAWSPGGELFFCQGLHCFSHVQTPWGNRHLEEHGSWRLRPLRRQLSSYRRTSGGGNPWGYAFGDWGEPFIKSNNPGVSELLPSLVQTDHIGGGYWGGAMQIGATKIKSMIIEIVDSPHLPADFQGDFLIAGYFARNIARLRPAVNGAGHRLDRMEPILTSSHNAFRPVDLNTGPDGALYVADWFNPIIGHYQASLRHPDRDVKHGRIWRISAKDKPLIKAPNLADMTADELSLQLAAPLRRTRQLAKLRLMNLPKKAATQAVQRWIDKLRTDDPELEHHWYEAIGVFESHEFVNPVLLDRLLAANDYRARAYATRVAGRWHDRLADPLSRLRSSAEDPHPRVRLEAIVAVSEVPRADSIAIAAQATGSSTDPFINFAMSQAVHGLAEHWKPALLSGELKFRNPEHLIRVVSAYGGADLLEIVRRRLPEPAMVTILASLGNTADAEKALELGSQRTEVLRALIVSVRERKLRAPANAKTRLSFAIQSDSDDLRIEAIRLSALWKQNAHATAIRDIAIDREQPVPVRIAATKALGDLGGATANKTLAGLAGPDQPTELGPAAIAALARRNVKQAATRAQILLQRSPPEHIGSLLSALLQRSDGATALAGVLKDKPVAIDTAKLMRRWLNTVGRSDTALITALDRIIGLDTPLPEDTADLVHSLARQALAKGNAASGRQIFQQPLVSCTACHEVDGVAGANSAVKGPNLSAVAAGLPIQLIVESLLWPARQIKEGYQATLVTTKDGRIISGFASSEDRQLVRVRDLTTGELATVRKADIKSRSTSGSMMPPGLTAGLTQPELLDLIKYLSTLKTGGQ